MVMKNSLMEIKRALTLMSGPKLCLRLTVGDGRRFKEPEFWKKRIRRFSIVKLDQDQHAFKRVSYSYADILTETVEVTVCNPDGQVRITYAPQS